MAAHCHKQKCRSVGASCWKLDYPLSTAALHAVKNHERDGLHDYVPVCRVRVLRGTGSERSAMQK